MKIVCPSCQAQYEVPDIVVTSRRKMRCARCSGEWVPADLGAPEPPPRVEEILASSEEPASAAELDEPVYARPYDSASPPMLPDEPVHEEEPARMGAPEPVTVETAFAPESERPPLKARRSEPRVSVLASLPGSAAVAEGAPVLAWAASIALVLGLAAAAVIFRAPIMKAWPPSARLLGEK